MVQVVPTDERDDGALGDEDYVPPRCELDKACLSRKTDAHT
jgi:hypothetical protein